MLPHRVPKSVLVPAEPLFSRLLLLSAQSMLPCVLLLATGFLLSLGLLVLN
jgi:hypothetical protein